VDKKTGVHYPVCMEGARACPPEDVGAMPGYEDFLKAIRNKRHPEHKELLAWIGGHFDPEAFDPEAINLALSRLT
jgi:Plasmid pRiA4b ORF-3-like protein